MSAVRVARAATRPREDRQVRRVLSRPRRRVSGPGRIGRADAGRPDQPRRDARRGRRHAGRQLQRSRRRSSVSSTPTAVRSPRVIVEPIAGNMGVVPPADGFLRALRELCTAHGALLIFDEVISGFRAAPGGAQAASRRRARPHVPRKDHRRRPAGRRLWRTRRPDGAGLAGRPRLSGRHALGQSAGDDRRHLVPRPAEAASVSPAGRARRRGSRPAWPTRRARPASPLQVNAFGSLLTPFFTDQPGARLSRRRRAPTPSSTRRFFRGMLARGVYPPPSQFEAWFLSAAHTAKDVDKTIAAAREAMRELKREFKISDFRLRWRQACRSLLFNLKS